MCDSIRDVVGCVGELARIHDQRGAIWWDRDISSSATNVRTSDLSKYPFGVFSVNHSPVSDKTCPANQDVPVQP